LEGGGLNSPTHHRYLTGRQINSTVELNSYMMKHSYPSYLAKKLNCTYINNGMSRASNELILKSLYECINTLDDTTELLVTIQTSILSRILVYLEDEQRFETVNGPIKPTYLNEYYELYVKHFYNHEIEYKKLLQNIDLYTTYLKSKNIDFVWIIADTADNLIIPSKHILSFDGRGLIEFGIGNKLRLCDLSGYPTNDSHFSESGNEIIADRIVKHLEEYYGN
jgi:hypothetical protein